MNHILLLLLATCLGLTAGLAQDSAKHATRITTPIAVKKAVPKEDLYWGPVKVESHRMAGQVGTDFLNGTERELVQKVTFPAVTDGHALLQKGLEKVTGGLESLGLVQVTKEDLKRIPYAHTLGWREKVDGGEGVAIFRPKDQASFEALAPLLEVFGDRDLGQMAYYLRGLYIQVTEQIRSTNEASTVNVYFKPYVYGEMLTAEDMKPAGPGVEIDRERRNSQALILKMKVAIKG